MAVRLVKLPAVRLRRRAAGGPPRALVLVRNAVTHDTRVLREAATLRDLGFDVLIAGSVSEKERRSGVRVDGFRVVRLLGPAGLLRSLLVRRAGPVSARGDQGGRTEGRKRRGRLGRLAIALAYTLQGTALAWRSSPALVHANDYETMWAGVAAKVLRGSRLVYDSHELWADRNGRREWRPWLLVNEALFVRAADATVTVSPGLAEVIARRYRVAPPVVVRNVPQRVATSPALAEGLRAGKAPLAVYVGGLTTGRGIEQAIEALARVPGLRLRLLGPGSDEARSQLAQSAAAAGVAERVELREPVPPTEVADAIAGADMGLVLIQPICLSYELSLPNKLFEYAAAGLPMVASDLPVIGALVRAEGIGEAVPPDDVEAIAAAMRRLADPRRNAEVRERVKSFAARATWANERHLLEQLYRSVVSAETEARLAGGPGTRP